MSRRGIAGLLAGIAAIVAIYSVYWWVIAGRFPEVIDAWAAERRQSGWQVDYTIGPVRGFPWALRSEIAAARLAGPTVPGSTTGASAWVWRPPPLAVHARPWRITKVAFEFPGPHQASLLLDRSEVTVAAAASSARGNLTFGTGQWPEMDLAFGDVTLASSAQPLSTTVKSLVARLAPQVAPNRPPTARPSPAPRLVITALDIVLPETPPPVFGRAVERFDLDATWIGRVPTGPLKPALAAWRDDGGTLEVARVRVKWGTLDIEGSGTFALDAELRPLASSNVRLQGYGPALDELARAGMVRGRDAIAARLMLGLMARSGRNGKDEVTVPVTIQDGWFAVGPARLLRVPPLALE